MDGSRPSGLCSLLELLHAVEILNLGVCLLLQLTGHKGHKAIPAAQEGSADRPQGHSSDCGCELSTLTCGRPL